MFLEFIVNMLATENRLHFLYLLWNRSLIYR